MEPAGPRIGRWEIALGVYALVCLAALTWPGYAWFGNRIDPTILGVPFSFAWNVGWVLLSFLALAAYHAVSRRED